MSREKFSLKNALENPKHFNILFLLYQYKNARLMHLSYILCKEHGLKIDEIKKKHIMDYFNPLSEADKDQLKYIINKSYTNMKKRYNDRYKKGLISKEEKNRLIEGEEERRKESIINIENGLTIYQSTKYFNENDKYTSYTNLSNTLKRMMEIRPKIITKQKIDGFNYYLLTNVGQIWVKKRIIHDIVDDMSDDHKILDEIIIFLLKR